MRLAVTLEAMIDRFPGVKIHHGVSMASFEEDGIRKPYTKYCVGFDRLVVVPEGCPMTIWSDDPQEILDTFWKFLTKLIEGKSRVVIRRLPTLGCVERYDPFCDTITRQYQITCRMYME